MIQVGDTLELQITDISHEGQGIGKADGLAVFVPGTLPGDRALVRLTRLKKNYGTAALETLLAPSPERQAAFCPVADVCGGCPLAGYKPEAQQELKGRWISERISRLGGVTDPLLRPAAGTPGALAYRNKATFVVSTGGNRKVRGGAIENLGPVVVGYRKAGSREALSCQSCRIQAPPALAMAEALRRFMEEDGLSAWDENWQQGLFRHLVVRTAFDTKEVQGVLVINGKGIPGSEKLIRFLDEAVLETGFSLESLYLNVNKDKTPEIFGKETRLLAGAKTIHEDMGPLTFEISPLSFYQVNPEATRLLYDKVLEYAALTGKERVLDLYCGVGTIGLYCAAGAKSVLGVESVREAVLDANRNAVINGIVNARFLQGKAEEILPTLLEGGEEGADPELAEWAAHPDVVILDPPRAGCHPSLLEAVRKAAPQRIVYVSCDPATLGRDVGILREGGYRFVEATPVDMFPWTLHVEAIILMTRSGSSDR